MPGRTIHVAVPVQDERLALDACVDALLCQDAAPARFWFCVNQPDSWHAEPERREICEANRESLRQLRELSSETVTVIDRTSPGCGWPPKRGGVGHARKTLMDAICETADDDDLIVSLDADTIVPDGYLADLRATFVSRPELAAVAARYFHPLSAETDVTRAMLGYEIYMRLYALNMWRIESPYAFTALGSAIALPVSVYRKLGGITPRTSSEDFYFLQKLVKHGRVLHWTADPVRPGTRKSWRVPVGTGQAIVAACEGSYRDRYPLYPSELFDRVGETTALFPRLHRERCATPLDDFLADKLGQADPWQPLRENSADVDRFVRACHERLDGLRILQFLKSEYRSAPTEDRLALRGWLERHGAKIAGFEDDARRFGEKLAESGCEDWTIEEMDALRTMLFRMEDGYRKRDAFDG